MSFAVHRRPSWAIPDLEATPYSAFVNRRAILAGLGVGALGLGAGLPRLALAQEADPTADLYPARKNESFKLDRDLTPEEINGHYNNFYEYGTQKTIARAAQALKTRPWDIEIGGLVEKPFTIAFDDLVRKIPLETRLYRHRCVEAWSMTIPWTGVPLKELVALAKPQGSAKFVRFETFLDPDMAPGQNDFLYPWPYIEGVTIEEAGNDLAFMVTGAYDKPLVKQHGAPLRVALPWKYGFKSIKSIRKIDFVEERPVGLWEAIQPSEYGFWANVNPEVPHPRWSQAMERVLHTGEFVPTLIYNGYGEQVAGLYAGVSGEKLFM
ncbi:protein-methionine-sulfoxide reductase catalytic subunit MsrP [Pseudaminobacter sp. 19-2017]|uniref:Protein-methionine-sulfoxide reductase catalytic subunit MsrP n=1 Tax=Pseudaminobacter soli (ex Zhang et al. 2022) TaxID=2831468 RepID=A0A942DZK1_9HYPH|nr:protein-methionine-sulfoxide reductase catalytic subunit MsrP [Pseudaminobacter soli]MBS3650939.1 protein-methionine-sulfoxide reductase catalytic subunit MsrP [Pseudaminobacter soli]